MKYNIINGWMDRWIDGWMDTCIRKDGRTDRRTDVRTDRQTDTSGTSFSVESNGTIARGFPHIVIYCDHTRPVMLTVVVTYRVNVA